MHKVHVEGAKITPDLVKEKTYRKPPSAVGKALFGGMRNVPCWI